MLEASSLLIMLVLTHVVADFVLPFKRMMSSTAFPARMLGLAWLAGVRGVAVFLLMLLARPGLLASRLTAGL